MSSRVFNEEVWSDIQGYVGYQVSTFGNVRSIKFFKIKELKPYIDKDGYLIVSLSNKGKPKAFKVHRLVASAFIENTNSLPIVNHIDSNKKNNNVVNLEWTTPKGNTIHAWINKRMEKARETCRKNARKNTGEKNGRCILSDDDCFEIIRIYNLGFMSQNKIADIFGVSQTNISSIIRGNTRKNILKLAA